MKDSEDKSVAVGDVIQILPASLNNVFNGCLGVVNQVKGWGIIADIYVTNGECYPVRLAGNQFKWIGRAAYIRKET
jgi:predicted ribonuclease YlaK